MFVSFPLFEPGDKILVDVYSSSNVRYWYAAPIIAMEYTIKEVFSDYVSTLTGDNIYKKDIWEIRKKYGIAVQNPYFGKG